MDDRRDLDRRVSFIFVLLLAFDLRGRLLHDLAGDFRLFLLLFCFPVAFLVVLPVVRRLIAVRFLVRRGRRRHLVGILRHGAFDLARIRNVQHGRGHAVCSGKHACNARGKFAVWAVVNGDQQSLEIGDEPALLQFLALDPLLLLLAHRDAIKRPA